ncbi:MAG: zinc-binding dehydrogenase [Defluviitaleaceae bacterium]|nr:zinc-binding dehydrogenase [Defluviitaleaceae bacterium]
MRTKAVRLYGEKDLRLESYDLPPITSGEILVKIITDSLCLSSYKAAIQGARHKRVPDGVFDNPVIIGHEFCGEIVEVGDEWANEWKAGEKFAIQPAINYKGSLYAPGYSYTYLGGDATYAVVPREFMECNCLLHYNGDAFFHGSLAEPVSCIVGAFHASYHTKAGSYVHKMGIKEKGRMAILAGAGPMGLGAIDYALHGPLQPSVIVVTDINEDRLRRAESLLTKETAKKAGVELHYVNTKDMKDQANGLIDMAGGSFDDVFVYAPVQSVVETADKILNYDGCMNFFAGPTDPAFSAAVNFYNVHYNATHIAGTSGGNTDDMIESLELMEAGRINPAAMVTHIGGIDAVIDATLNLPSVAGGKILIYTHMDMPITPISEMENSGEPFLRELGSITKKHNGLWSVEAEKYLLSQRSDD